MNVATEELLSSSLSIDVERSLYVLYMTDSLNSQRFFCVFSPSPKARVCGRFAFSSWCCQQCGKLTFFFFFLPQAIKKINKNYIREIEQMHNALNPASCFQI